MILETNWRASEYVQESYKGRGIRLSEDSENILNINLREGMAYGETKRVSVEIDSIRGRKTKKYFTAVIYRFENTGRYEVSTYVL